MAHPDYDFFAGAPGRHGAPHGWAPRGQVPAPRAPGPAPASPRSPFAPPPTPEPLQVDDLLAAAAQSAPRPEPPGAYGVADGPGPAPRAVRAAGVLAVAQGAALAAWSALGLAVRPAAPAGAAPEAAVWAATRAGAAAWVAAALLGVGLVVAAAGAAVLRGRPGGAAALVACQAVALAWQAMSRLAGDDPGTAAYLQRTGGLAGTATAVALLALLLHPAGLRWWHRPLL